ncbi:peptidoglycan-binding protein, partial [Nonomuraea sp. NN258]
DSAASTAPETMNAELVTVATSVSTACPALTAARQAHGRILEKARQAREKRLEELKKAVRTAKEAVLTAEQALRQARQLSPTKLKVANAEKDVAAARSMLAEYARTYGVSVPPGEIVFLPKLPARVQRAAVKAGQAVETEVATVTSSAFMVSGAVEAAESDLLRPGMRATIEVESGKTYPATLTAIGERAKVPGEEPPGDGAQPVLLTPLSMTGLKGLTGTAVTARVTVGATDEPVLVVPVAAVITSADGRSRVEVEYAPDKTRQVEVRTGLAADGRVEVTGDLKEGDRVVVNSA